MKWCLSPVLYSGTTLAIFMLLGNFPVWNDKLQMYVSGSEIPSMTFFTTFISISFESVDVLCLHLFTISMISFSSTAVRNIELGFLTIRLSFQSSGNNGSGIFLARFGPTFTKKLLKLLTTSSILSFLMFLSIKY